MPANNKVWTHEMEDRLLQLLEKNVAYYDIARAISREFKVTISKNACIGKGRRMQVPLRMPARKGRACRKSQNENLSQSPKNLQQRQRRKRANESLRKQRQSQQLRVLRSRRAQRHQHQHLTLLQLTSNSCRWPIGDRAPYLFCGAVQTEGSSYCLEHTLVACPSHGRQR